MRKIAVLPLAALVAAGGAGAAVAQTGTGPEQTIDAQVSSTNAGTRHHPRRVELDVTTTTTMPDGSQPPAVKEAVVYFPKGFRFNGRRFASCSVDRIAAGKACPRSSRIGEGAAEAIAGSIAVKPTITVYNAARGKRIVFVLNDPMLGGQVPLEGTITRAGGDYSRKLTLEIPDTIRHPIPGLTASLTKFATDIEATRKVRVRRGHRGHRGHHGRRHHRTRTKRLGYVETVRCPKGGWQFKGLFTTEDGRQLEATDTIACKR